MSKVQNLTIVFLVECILAGNASTIYMSSWFKGAFVKTELLSHFLHLGAQIRYREEPKFIYWNIKIGIYFFYTIVWKLNFKKYCMFFIKVDMDRPSPPECYVLHCVLLAQPRGIKTVMRHSAISLFQSDNLLKKSSWSFSFL